jgi:nitrate reductase NapE component
LKILSSSKQDLKASVLDSCFTYFLYLSIGLHACVVVGIVGNLMYHIFP